MTTAQKSPSDIANLPDDAIHAILTDALAKLLGNISFDVDNTVRKQFFRYLDHGRQFVGPNRNLAEGIVRFRDRAFLIHPGCRSL